MQSCPSKRCASMNMNFFDPPGDDGSGRLIKVVRCPTNLLAVTLSGPNQNHGEGGTPSEGIQYGSTATAS